MTTPISFLLVSSKRMLKSACFIFSLSLISTCSTDQSNVTNKLVQGDYLRLITTAYDHPYFAPGDSLFARNEYDSTIDAYQQASTKFQLDKDERGFIRSLNLIGYNLRIIEQYERSRAYMDSALMLGQAKLETNDLIIAETHYFLGQYFDDIGDTVRAFQHHRIALKNRLQVLPSYHKELSKSYNAIGNIYRFSLFDYTMAEKYYLKSLKIKEYLYQFAGPTRDLAISYYNLATTSRLKADYDNVLLYAEKSLSIHRKDSARNGVEIANCFIAISNGYFQKGEYDNCIRYGKQARSILNNAPQAFAKTKVSCLNTIGRAYSEKNEFEQAKQYYRQALQVSIASKRDFSDLAYCYLNLGDVYKMLSQFDSAVWFQKRCLTIRSEHYSAKHPEISFALYSIGNTFTRAGVYDSGLIYYQKALIAGISDFNKMDSRDNPTIYQMAGNYEIPFILGAKAQVLRLKTVSGNRPDTALLTQALQVFRLAEKGLVANRQVFNGEQAKLDIVKRTKDVYEGMLDCAYTLFGLYPTQELQQILCGIFLKSKSSLLRENVSLSRFVTDDPLLDSLITGISTASVNLNSLLLQSRAAPNDLIIRNQAYKLNQTLDSLKGKLAAKSPRFFSTYFQTTTRVAELKAFYDSSKSVVIDFFRGTQNLYAMIIAADSLRVIRFSDYPEITTTLESYLINVSTPPAMLNGTTRFREFVDQSYRLQQLLLAPVFNKLSDQSFKNLIIVPDGELQRLPFETLLKSGSESSTVNYQTLDYLLKHYAVTYQYASFPERSPRSKESRGMLTVGNEYRNSADKIQVLPGIRKETENIHRIMGGRLLLNKNATEDNFKNDVKKFDLVHVSLHGTGNPDGSDAKLEFFKTDKDVEDGQLHLYEIYPLHIPARMVSLMSCESGSGQQFTGEGVYSMARAFSYAGCPTLVSSLFPVNNQSAIEMSEVFYLDIRQGRPVHESLRRAKLQYLENADEVSAHPALWGSLVVIGDTNPIALTSHGNRYYVIVIVLVLLTSLIIFLRLRKR